MLYAIVGEMYFGTTIFSKELTYTSPKFLGLDLERRYIYEDSPTENTLLFSTYEAAGNYIVDHDLNNASNIECCEVTTLWEEI